MKMIRIERLEQELEGLRSQWNSADPFPHVIIDNFLTPEAAEILDGAFPNPSKTKVNKSRDYMFAKNKFEKSGFRNISADTEALYQELLDPRLAKLIAGITGKEIFVDPSFHGGGMHISGEGSFLDMHVDFNMHPVEKKWHRHLNLLLYMNKGWEDTWGGKLKIRHRDGSKTTEVAPIFNRAVLMVTNEISVHGFSPIHFPEDRYRKSFAIYCYYQDGTQKKPRVTRWYPEKGGRIKKVLGYYWPTIVRIKSKFLGSSTKKNQ